MSKEKKGQVWIETVLYILIGLALIGLTLAIVTPKINQAKDKILVEQSIETLNVLDEKIRETLDRGQGNSRVVSVLIKKGKLTVNPQDETIKLKLSDLRKPFSEVGVPVPIGEITVLTTGRGKLNDVALTLNYSSFLNLTYLENDAGEKEFSATPSPYSIAIRNLGKTNISNFDELFIIDIREGR